MPAPPVLLALLLCSAGPEAEDAHVRYAEALLNGWEATTADRIPVSAADRAAARWARPGAPEELLTLAADLQGPIDAADLRARYKWRVVDLTTPIPRLIATPRDPLVQAFIPQLSIRLATDFTPQTVAVSRPGGRVVAVGAPGGNEIIRVGASNQQDARPSPIRTAQYVKPAGDGPTWKIERRLKKTPATQLVNNPRPLIAPQPE